MLALPELSCTDKAALGFIAVSVPFNVFMWLCPRFVPNPKFGLGWDGCAYVMIGVVGQYVGIAALALLLAHFGWIYGVLFASASALLLLLFQALALAHTDADTKQSSDDL